MKHLQTFESFLFEANLSDELMSFITGDTITVTKDFKPTDLDFRKSATTWWGQKVSALKNHWAKDEMKFNPDRTYKAGDPLFVFTKPTTLSPDGNATIYGYAGYFFGLNANKDQDPNDFALTSYDMAYSYSDMLTQTLILAILGGYAKVGKYTSIPSKLRDEFEASIKRDRITHELIDGNTVIYDGMEIHKWEWTKQGYIFTGFDTKTGNEMPKKLVKFSEMTVGKFVCNGKIITSDPFKK